MTAKEDRAERLAAQLRGNLRKRKQAREGTPSPAPDDQCASASDPSDVAAPAA